MTIGTTVATAESLRAGAYETMVDVALESGDSLEEALTRWRPTVATADAVVVGPGFPMGPQFVDPIGAAWSEWPCPAVFDADGLNHLAKAANLSAPGGPRVMTPHPGEAARLLGCSSFEIEANRPAALRRIVDKFGAVVVLKGAHTLVGDPKGAVALCPDGNPGMASAGMGDVLSGMIGALLGRGVDAMAAACAGVLWHARAGDVARDKRGENGLLARDVIDALGDVERR